MISAYLLDTSRIVFYAALIWSTLSWDAPVLDFTIILQLLQPQSCGLLRYDSPLPPWCSQLFVLRARRFSSQTSRQFSFLQCFQIWRYPSYPWAYVSKSLYRWLLPACRALSMELNLSSWQGYNLGSWTSLFDGRCPPSFFSLPCLHFLTSE